MTMGMVTDPPIKLKGDDDESTPAQWLGVHAMKYAVEFAEKEYPISTTGWIIRREGDKDLAGSPERGACPKQKGYVHIVLDVFK